MEMHTTKDGTQMLIAEMNNDHLLNTIKTWCQKIKVSREILENPNKIQQNVVLQAINKSYSLESTMDRATDLIETSHKKLLPYCLEAALRGLEITPTLQEAYGRKEGVAPLSQLAIKLFFGQSQPEIFIEEDYD
ncbi:hypothetical protein [Synechocystis sp. LKSZ1]|uniref:hypothetical protein n=1 Tax=Synechocystis sp. LKSZ1 TaxID=3144951 RepID=UPI00336C1400